LVEKNNRSTLVKAANPTTVSVTRWGHLASIDMQALLDRILRRIVAQLSVQVSTTFAASVTAMLT
jgi:hypothetical protein